MAHASATATIVITPSGGGQVLTFTFDPSLVVYSTPNDVSTFSTTADTGAGPYTTEVAFYDTSAYALYHGGIQLDFEFFLPGVAPYYSAILQDFTGAQLYSGPESNPTLLPGTYNVNTEPGGSLATLVLTLTPEPSSLLLLLTGLTAVGFVVSRRPAIASLTDL